MSRVTRIGIRFIALLLLVIPVMAKADPERRIALVVGIGAYRNAPALANPVNDARAIGETLRRLQFDVTEIYDTDYRALSTGIREFGIRATTADVAVVYYAGHGVQVDRENYLIPADARLERERDLLYEAMPLDRLLGEVSQASKIGIVLLDSCRNNPFIERVSRSITVAGRAVATTPGLARVDNVPRNTMVVMAAKADQIAEDGQDHSPFAAALLAHFQIPGLELSLFFRSVRDTVLRATGNRQEPYVFSSLGADPFYFYPRPPNRPPEIASIRPLELTDAAGPTPLGLPQPTDPDQDPLTIRVIGLPRSGEVRIDGRPAAINTVVSAERLRSATYKPDGKIMGPVGTLDLLIEDGRGGSITASLPISVRSSRRPPVVGAPGHVRMAQQALGIPVPVSPDNDPLTVTIAALPRGLVRNGTSVLHVGDRVAPDDLPKLSFTPEAGFSGSAGSLRYTVDNGHGDTADGTVEIDVAASSSPDVGADVALWNTLRTSNDPDALEAFVKLFPKSRFAADAQRQRDALIASGKAQASVAGNAASASGSPIAASDPVAQLPASSPTAPEPRTTIAAATPPAVSQATPPRSSQLATASNAIPAIRAPTPGNNATNRFQDCATCPSMVKIPAGEFIMGQGSRLPEALPAHRVTIRAFALGATPITVAEWNACMAAQGCNFLPRMRVADDRTPVHNLSWLDASQYITWLSRSTGQAYRLPSEAEWEYAARAGSNGRYWWGDAPGVAQANCADCGGQQSNTGPLPVDAFSPNPFGLYAMLGGVAQWTADCWFPNYQGAPGDFRPREAKSCDKRVLRGGSFRDNHDAIAIVARGNYDAPVRYIVNGFRLARDLE